MLNIGRAPGVDRITAEMRSCGDAVAEWMHKCVYSLKSRRMPDY